MTVKELHANYNGEMGTIGYVRYTKETAIQTVKKHMSKELLSKLNEYKKANDIVFNMYTYTTKEDGAQEVIQDFNGKYYGLNHEMSGGGFWGFE